MGKEFIAFLKEYGIIDEVIQGAKVAAINALAMLYFIFYKMVYWPDVTILAIGTIVGGYLGVAVARRAGQKTVRRLVVLIGFGMGISLLFKH